MHDKIDAPTVCIVLMSHQLLPQNKQSLKSTQKKRGAKDQQSTMAVDNETAKQETTTEQKTRINQISLWLGKKMPVWAATYSARFIAKVLPVTKASLVESRASISEH